MRELGWWRQRRLRFVDQLERIIWPSAGGKID
jgi:hypothetical protein